MFKDYSYNVNKNYLIKRIKRKPHCINKIITEKIFNDKYNTNYHISYLHTMYNFNKYACEHSFNEFYDYFKKTFSVKIRKYDNFNVDVKSRRDFSFIAITFLMQHYLNLSIQSSISFIAISSKTFNNYYYKKIIKLKPKIININKITDENESQNAWIKFQNNYLKLFDK